MQLKLEVFWPLVSQSWNMNMKVGGGAEWATQAKHSLFISVIEYCFMYFCCKNQLFGHYTSLKIVYWLATKMVLNFIGDGERTNFSDIIATSLKIVYLASYKNGITFHRWWWCWWIHHSFPLFILYSPCRCKDNYFFCL